MTRLAGDVGCDATNQRNSRVYCLCFIDCRSDRTKNRIWIWLTRISGSGAIEG